MRRIFYLTLTAALVAAVLVIISHLLQFSDLKFLLSRDFSQDYLMGRAILDRSPVYINLKLLTDNYFPGNSACIVLTSSPHPPSLVLLLSPLALLEITLASYFWYGVSLTLLILSVHLSLRLRDLNLQENKALFLSTVAIIIISLPASFDLLTGQVNFLILFIALIHSLAFQKGKKLAAGIALGALVSLKLFGAVFLLYYILTKEFKVLLGCVTVLLTTTAACWFVLGPETLNSYIYETLPSTGSYWAGALGNISLYSIPIKLSDNLYFENMTSDCHWKRIIPTPNRSISISAMFCTAVFILFAMWCVFKEKTFYKRFLKLMAASAVINPISWIHYTVTCIPLFIDTFYELLNSKSNNKRTFIILVCFAALAFLDYSIMPPLIESGTTGIMMAPYIYNLISIIPTVLILMLILL